MKLRTKALLIFAGTYILLLSGVTVISYIIHHNFTQKKEHAELERLISFGRERISLYQKNINTLCQAWSSCTRLHNYIQKPDDEYINNYFNPRIFKNSNQISYALIFNRSLTPVYEAEYSAHNKQVTTPSPIIRIRIVEEGYAEKALEGTPTTGFLQTNNNVFYLCSYPVYQSPSATTPSGIMVLCSRLPDTLYDIDRDKIWQNFSIKKINQDLFLHAPSQPEALNTLSNKPTFNTTKDFNFCSYLYRDLNNSPAFWLIAKQKRLLYHTGLRILINFIIFIAILILFNIFLIFFFMEYSIFNRIIKITEEIDQITRNKNTTGRLKTGNSNDEIDQFSKCLNNMLARMDTDEKELTISNKRFSLIFETSLDAVVWCDPESRQILNCNQALEKMTGRDRNDLISQPYELLFPPEEKYQYLLERQVRLESYDSEVEIITAQSKRIPVKLTSTATKIDSCHILQSVFHDISDMKLAENKLSDSLIQEQYNNRIKTEFLKNISHELRTPLTAIMGFSELVLSNSSNEKKVKWLEGIHTESQQLLSLINDLLDNARIEVGSLPIEQQPFDLANMLDEITVIADKLAKNKEIAFFLNTDTNLARMYIGDKLRIKQIILNMISNAIKFTVKGSVTLRVETGSEENSITFTIIDTGTGISQEQKDAIVSCFKRKEIGEGSSFGSCGLSTTIALNLIRLMGGDINLQSAIGQGSTFTFSISLKRYTPEIDATEQVADERPFKQTILLLEEYDANTKVIEAFSIASGYRVDSCNNFATAIKHCSEHEYALIMTEIELAESCACDFAQQVRSSGLNINTPIIAMCNDIDNAVYTKCLNAQINDILPKPFTQNSFNNAIIKWVKAPPLPTQSSSDTQENDTLQVATDVTTDIPSSSEPTAETEAIKPPEELLFPDEPTVKKFFANKRELAEQAFDMFMADSAKMLSKLQEEAENENYEEVQKLSHQIKSGAGYMGLSELQKSFQIVNDKTLDNQLDSIEENIKIAASLFNKVHKSWEKARK